MLKEKEFTNLDNQTLIKMLMATAGSNQKLSEDTAQLQKSVNVLIEEVVNLCQHRFGRSSEKKLTSEECGYSQLCFAFNETEMTIERNPAFPEPELKNIFPKSYKRGKKKTGKEQGCSGDCGSPYPVGRRTVLNGLVFKICLLWRVFRISF